MMEDGRRGRRRRFGLVLLLVFVLVGIAAYNNWRTVGHNGSVSPAVTVPAGQEPAIRALGRLAIRERAPREGYARDQFGSGWATTAGCDTRNRILRRDLGQTVLAEDVCTVLSGVLEDDPYTAKSISFTRGPGTSTAIQIDHVVALSDAWQKGAQNLSPERRREFANDGLNLLATDGPVNMEKGDSDAAEWLPPNKSFRCRYIARQIAVKLKYTLWVTRSEHSAMNRSLQTCPSQVLPIEDAS